MLLFSGYLLDQQQLLSEEAFDTFLDHLRKRGCAIATSDPLGGLMPSAVTHLADSRAAQDHPYSDFEAAVLRVFVRPYERLKHFSHVYAYAHDQGAPQHRAIFSYFTPKASGDPTSTASEDTLREALGCSLREPYWLFTIGQEDYEMQCAQLGRTELVARVAVKLDTASRLDRNVVFVGPGDLVQALEGALPPSGAVRMFPYVPYLTFAHLNLHAEYVFYWTSSPSRRGGGY